MSKINSLFRDTEFGPRVLSNGFEDAMKKFDFTKRFLEKFLFELSREIISSEINQFDYSPEKYLEALNFNIDDYEKIYELKDSIDFSEEDINDLRLQLQGIIIKILDDCESITDFSIALRESNVASDFACNFVSGKINELYPTLK